jgi:hypothetical protein
VASNCVFWPWPQELQRSTALAPAQAGQLRGGAGGTPMRSGGISGANVGMASESERGPLGSGSPNSYAKMVIAQLLWPQRRSFRFWRPKCKQERIGPAGSAELLEPWTRGTAAPARLGTMGLPFSSRADVKALSCHIHPRFCGQRPRAGLFYASFSPRLDSKGNGRSSRAATEERGASSKLRTAVCDYVDC